jgi:hypothetical protein
MMDRTHANVLLDTPEYTLSVLMWMSVWQMLLFAAIMQAAQTQTGLSLVRAFLASQDPLLLAQISMSAKQTSALPAFA